MSQYRHQQESRIRPGSDPCLEFRLDRFALLQVAHPEGQR
jgi:hypothetical protein